MRPEHLVLEPGALAPGAGSRGARAHVASKALAMAARTHLIAAMSQLRVSVVFPKASATASHAASRSGAAAIRRALASCTAYARFFSISGGVSAMAMREPSLKA